MMNDHITISIRKWEIRRELRHRGLTFLAPHVQDTDRTAQDVVNRVNVHTTQTAERAALLLAEQTYDTGNALCELCEVADATTTAMDNTACCECCCTEHNERLAPVDVTGGAFASRHIPPHDAIEPDCDCVVGHHAGCHAGDPEALQPTNSPGIALGRKLSLTNTLKVLGLRHQRGSHYRHTVYDGDNVLLHEGTAHDVWEWLRALQQDEASAAESAAGWDAAP